LSDWGEVIAQLRGLRVMMLAVNGGQVTMLRAVHGLSVVYAVLQILRGLSYGFTGSI
jgi:hypothetical protein